MESKILLFDSFEQGHSTNSKVYELRIISTLKTQKNVCEANLVLALTSFEEKRLLGINNDIVKV